MEPAGRELAVVAQTSCHAYDSARGVTVLFYGDGPGQLLDDTWEWDGWETHNQMDCNTNLIPDECDINGGTSTDCNTNAVPDECESDCQPNGVPDECDIADGTSQDANQNGIPDECEPCIDDDDCDDGFFCNGDETCTANGSQRGPSRQNRS